jgi:hypothetical protein
MITIQMMNTAWDNRETAQTMKAPVTKFSVDECMVVLGRSAILVLIIPSSNADATAEKIPNTPPNPAKR